MDTHNYDIIFTYRGIIINKSYIISDLHIGQSINIQSMSLEDERDEIIPNIEAVLNSHNIDKLIIAGDIFDQHKRPENSHIKVLDDINDIVQNNDCELVLIRGNHDENTTDYMLHNFLDYYNLDNTIITHGHKLLDNVDSDLYIVGHIHPTIRIQGKIWPIYLVGYSKEVNSNIIVLPSYTKYQDGNIIKKNTKNSFYYIDDYSDFKPYIYDSSIDQVRKMPEMKKIEKYIN